MKKLFTAVFLSIASLASAQNIQNSGCGTITSQAEIEDVYDFVQHNPLAYAKTAGVIDSIPLSLHIVGTDAGAGYYSLNNLFPVICQLNERFAPVNFHFYIKWPIQYINSSAYYQHNFGGGYNMMTQNNVPNSVNIYFVQDPAGNCGYYTSGADAVAIGKNCAGSGNTTVAHELGHYFTLPHTFYGWENGNTPSRPELVRRSGPGTNCNNSGDGFCDTYADYFSGRWNCPGPVGKTDDSGDLYRLDSSMYMSYSSDPCQSRFSAQQIARMQYNLRTTRRSFPNAVNPKSMAMDTARIVYPADTLYANVKKGRWNKVPGADYYFVRISLQSSPKQYLQTTLTKDTFTDITANIVDGGLYLIDITPVNAHDVCLNYSAPRPFTFADRYANLSVGTAGASDAQLVVYPNPVSAGADLNVNFQAMPPGNYTLSLTTISGQTVRSQEYKHTGGTKVFNFNTQTCAEGLYFLRWKSEVAQGATRIQVR